MRPFMHEMRLASVHHLGDRLLARTTQCGTGRETAAQLWIEPKTLKILGATWEVHRFEGEDLPPAVEIPALQGVVAYFGCGKSLQEALAAYPPVALTLFRETVGAVIQAETFLLEERGFSSLDEYAAYWEKFYTGTCRYYSNLDAIEQTWAAYVAGRRPGTHLFNRFKTLSLDRDQGGMLLRAAINDSFHEMAFSLHLDPAGETVREAAGAIIRAPDRLCFGAATFIERLEGVRLPGLTRAETASLLGEEQGCVHLIDLAAEAVTLLQAARERRKKNESAS
ncbi:MAG: DUF2889 domain-containing protein [Thermoanaerobacteraceae bacterium]|nr:DUF2889 domain-containing protein [Thermoanaerobacteraceae bacterium]